MGVQSRIAAVAAQFGGLDELGVFVRAPGQHVEHVFGADDRLHVGFEVAVQGREEDVATRLDQAGASSDGARRVGHVLQHFHAGHDVEVNRHFLSQIFRADQAIVDTESALEQVQPRHAQCLFRQVYAGDPGAGRRHAFGQDAAAAADVEHGLVEQVGLAVDPAQA